MSFARQLPLDTEESLPVHKESNPGTFVGNMALPVHRWFRYSAGFSGLWAQALIAEESRLQRLRVFDPFAGSGTTLIAAEQCRVEAWGIDPHPFVARVAQAKLAYRSSPDLYLETAQRVLANAKQGQPSLASYPRLIRECYTDEALGQLDRLRYEIEQLPQQIEATKLVWLTLMAILRPTSHVGTANWQYLLPKHRKAKVEEPFPAFQHATAMFYGDMCLASVLSGPRAVFTVDDARYCDTVPSDHFNLVVTSPPYPNNYDYADSTRLELMFLQEIQGWGDLQAAIRQHLLRSCTQHVPDSSIDISEVLSHPALNPISDELHSVCERLGEVRLTKGGKKTYHNMIACYFLDLALAWKALRRVCASPARVCFVIGDSAPYGVYVPVMDWLGKLAIEAGFDACVFEKTRDRNVKWKNRKHTVPLCEGRLWVEG